MERFFKKYVWLFPVLVVTCCSFFAAKAANHYIESKFLPDVKPVAAKEKKSTSSSVAKPKLNGRDLVARNMFCSDCEPEIPVEGDSESTGRRGETSLPLSLVATQVSDNDEYSFASVLNTSNDRQGAYNIGQMIPDAGKVTAIYHSYIEFRNEDSKRTEKIMLLGDKEPSKPKKTTSKPTVKTTSKKPKSELLQAVEEGVKKNSDTDFELDRDVVNKVLENPAAIAKGARIVPSIKNGKSNGFKLYAIRPSSVYSKIGLKNGDTIHSINGFELSSPDKALEVYMKLREASSLSVNATRRGKPLTMNYSIK